MAPRPTGGGAGHVTKVRSAVTTARTDATEENSAEADAMRNLAYVVSSANDNIQALQRTVKLQEKELSEKTDQCAALQRNYETLARIRQADQNEFMQLKARQAEEHGQISRLQTELVQARQQNASLEQKLVNSEAAQSQIAELQKQLEEVTRARDGFQTELEQASRCRASGAASDALVFTSAPPRERFAQPRVWLHGSGTRESGVRRRPSRITLPRGRGTATRPAPLPPPPPLLLRQNPSIPSFAVHPCMPRIPVRRCVVAHSRAPRRRGRRKSRTRSSRRTTAA